MHTLSALYLYPVKSMAGIALPEAEVQARGLRYDRRWMLVDAQGRFVSQREVAELALLGTALEPPFLTIFSRKNPARRIQTPLEPPVHEYPEITVQIWNDHCTACVLPEPVNHWFSELLGADLRMVYLPDYSHRPVDPHYAPEGSYTGFSDGFPFLLIGQASLDDLNSRLSQPLPMNRFRPNLVVSGSAPFAEDAWADLSIGGQPFRCVKPCARCIVTTTDQDTAERSSEPLKTLASFRREGHKVLFGQNTLWLGSGEGVVLRVGDAVQVNL